MRRSVTHLVSALALALSGMTPGHAAPDTFTTDEPSPLKLVVPRKGDDTIVRFTGSIRLSGRFLVGWEMINRKPSHLRVMFQPDGDSAALLPRAVGSGPVKELLLSAGEQAAAAAVSMLLNPETAQKVLARELLSAEGEATVTIRDYRAVIDCDHRWYMAQLVSADSRNIVVGARESPRPGC